MKRIGTVFGFVFVLCAAMGFAACSQKVSDSDSSGGAEETKAKIAGLSYIQEELAKMEQK